MLSFRLPAWLLWFLLVLLIAGGIYGSYHYGFRKGDQSVACTPPDPDWNSIYFECFKAAYESGVTCPCNSQPIECLDILGTRAFSPYAGRAIARTCSRLIHARLRPLTECQPLSDRRGTALENRRSDARIRTDQAELR